jgi:hypothetical protein
MKRADDHHSIHANKRMSQLTAVAKRGASNAAAKQNDVDQWSKDWSVACCTLHPHCPTTYLHPQMMLLCYSHSPWLTATALLVSLLACARPETSTVVTCAHLPAQHADTFVKGQCQRISLPSGAVPRALRLACLVKKSCSSLYLKQTKGKVCGGRPRTP